LKRREGLNGGKEIKVNATAIDMKKPVLWESGNMFYITPVHLMILSIFSPDVKDTKKSVFSQSGNTFKKTPVPLMILSTFLLISKILIIPV